MPSMANITVKDSANVDVIYVAAAPSAGDRSPAIWRANALSPIIGFRPSFSVMTRDNQKQSGRIMEASFKFPILGNVNGQTVVLATVPYTFAGTIPTNIDSTLALNAFTQFGNLCASSLVRSIVSDGYAPT